MPIRALGYLRLVSPDVAAWRRFGEDVLGLMPGEPSDERCRFRIDDYPWRIEVRHGAEAGIEAIGFEVVDDRALDEAVARVEQVGIEVRRGTTAEAAELRVTGLASFRDPAGQPIELFYGPILTHAPLVAPLVPSGFVTGDMGMGHIVLNVADMDTAERFYRDVFGFHRRNTFAQGPMRMTFLGCNPRHHTLALGQGIPLPGVLMHFMAEVGSIDDVGRAQDRCVDAGVAVTSAIGKHTNDHMISFYCASPDGYMVEYGAGGVRVENPDSYLTYEITKTSFWGHQPLITG